MCPVTEFQKAAAAARRRYADSVWFTLTMNEQAKAIYDELRRIDTERATALVGPVRRSARTPLRPAASKIRPRRVAGAVWMPSADGLEA